jgi:hypothetical protein
MNVIKPDLTTFDYDMDAIVMRWLTSANQEGLRSWEELGMSAMDAIIKDYDENFLQPYYDMATTDDNRMRVYSEQRAYEQLKAPTMEEMAARVMEKYPGKFALEDILYVLQQKPQVYSVGEREAAGTPETKQKDLVFDILVWSGPSSGPLNDQLKQAFLDQGGNPNDWDMWYGTNGKWGQVPDYEVKGEYQKFTETLMKAATSINLEPPSDAELAEYIKVEELRNQFGAMVDTKWPDGKINTTLSQYYSKSSYAKRAFITEHPEVGEYNKMREAFATANPLYAKYFMPWLYEGGTGIDPAQLPGFGSATVSAGGSGYSGGSYGGGSYSGGGGGGGGGRTEESGSSPMGRRAGLTSADLAAPGALGKGGVVPWPPGFQKLAGSVAVDAIMQLANNQVPLDDGTKKYLVELGKQNTQYTEFIDSIMSQSQDGSVV